MKNFFVVVLSFALSVPLFAQSNEAYFLSQPVLTPDGKTVIFCFEGIYGEPTLQTDKPSGLLPCRDMKPVPGFLRMVTG